MDWIFGWLAHYGYAGLFVLLMLGIVGLPVPDETLLVFSGFLISRGRFNPALTYSAALVGTGAGISLSYCVGRTLGRDAVLRYGRRAGVTHQRLDYVHAGFCRWGEWLLAFGYFIPGVRHFTALVAGISKLEFTAFALFAWSGAAVWVAVFLVLGYFVGENWQTAMGLVHRYTLAAVLVCGCVLAVAWWLRTRLVKR